MTGRLWGPLRPSRPGRLDQTTRLHLIAATVWVMSAAELVAWRKLSKRWAS